MMSHGVVLCLTTDAPKLHCPPLEASVADANVCVRCDVNGKPKPTSMLWVVDGNGTSLAEGQVLDDYWTYSTVRTALLYSNSQSRAIFYKTITRAMSFHSA